MSGYPAPPAPTFPHQHTHNTRSAHGGVGTYRVDVGGEISRVNSALVVGVDGDDGRHEAQAIGLVVEAVEREFQIRCRDQPDEDVVADDREPAVDLARAVQDVEFGAQALGGDERRGGDVDEPLAANAWDNVGEIGCEDGFVLVVEIGVGV